MVKTRRVNPLLLAALGAALAVAVWFETRPEAAGPAAPSGSPSRRRPDPVENVPHIALSRLDAKAPAARAGDTDIFEFAASSARRGEAGSAPAPPPPTTAAAPVAAPLVSPTPPPVPVMNVKYIGTVADKKGLKVAVLMTDRREVLTGRPGDVVANRLKIVSIGLESVDVQDLGSDHVRRIPLRAN
jgi:hypothetical protein